jgi:signal transduction histidine kinase
MRTILKPIDTAEIPALQEFTERSLRLITLIYMGSYLAMSLTLLVMGKYQEMVLCLAMILLGAATFALLRVKRLLAWGEWLIIALHLSAAVLATMGSGWLNTLPGLMPILAISLIPMRPSVTGTLGLGCAAIYMVHAGTSAPEQTLHYLLLVTMAAISTVLAMGITQVQRHIWNELDSKRHQLIAADRLSTLGQHMAGIAHELKTPIAATLNELQSLSSLSEEMRESIGHPDVQDEDLHEICDEIDQHVKGLRSNANRTARFVRAIREHTRDLHKTDDVLFSAWDRLEAVSALLEHRLKKSPVSLDMSGVDRYAQIKGDGGRFDQIFINLISNAFEACEESGAGTLVEVYTETTPTGLKLIVHDDGPGVPLHLHEKIFEPLFTTRAGSTGTGLGLAVCRDIVQGVFGGTLELVKANQGARFEVFFPHPKQAGTTSQSQMPARQGQAFEPFGMEPAPQVGPQTQPNGPSTAPQTFH